MKFALPSLTGHITYYITVRHYMCTHQRKESLMLPTYFPLLEKAFIMALDARLFLANSNSGEYEHVLSTQIFRSSICKLNANMQIFFTSSYFSV